ncbi:MAG: hypothetical protein AAF939_00860 [Planctomycetota bacterium]
MLSGGQWIYHHDVSSHDDYDVQPWVQTPRSGVGGFLESKLGKPLVNSIAGVRLVKRMENIGMLWSYDTPIHETPPWIASMKLNDLNRLEAFSVDLETDRQVEIIRQMQDLEYLELISYIRRSTPEIGNLSQLKTLNLATRVKDVDWIQNLTTVKQLRLRKVGPAPRLLIDVGFLKNMPQLKELKLGAIRLSNLESLSSLVNLESLELVHTDVTELDCISQLPLEKIQIIDTPLANLDFALSMKTLQKLVLVRTAISSDQFQSWQSEMKTYLPDLKIEMIPAE